LSARDDAYGQDRTTADWDAFTKDVNDSFDKLESDLHDDLK
jgi:hypothetical protein